MASWEPDEIDFEDEYDKVDPIDDANLDESINELNESIREQEELEKRIRRAEWTSTNRDERTKLELIKALLGGPTTSTPTSQSTTTSDKKGGAREWIKKQIKSSITVIR